MTRVEPTAIVPGLEHARRRLVEVGGPFASQAEAVFENDADAVADWIGAAAHRALAGDYVEFGQPSPPADRLYLEMNRFEFNPDRWFMDAFPCAPPPGPDDPVCITPEFDAEVGYYIDTTVAELLVLSGMEKMQRLYEVHGGDEAAMPSAEAAEDVVRWSWFDLLDRAYRARAINAPVAAAVHDESHFLILGTRTA